MQNCQGWTAGSNLKKLRGFGEKFWAKLQLILNNSGPRVESGNSQGLFSKKFRPNRYPRTRVTGSGSNGLDLRSSGSNRGHSSEIGWLGGLGARGGGANRRSRAPRRRARRSWPFGRYRGSFGSRFGAKGPALNA